ncbi:hypothetical protein ACFQ14_08310 [Pseudahrensia aquimaris]|uniref:Uncharacterized protein n=1 Tax=Pseudahrensia aquimaris TaxID=744461 RepID=A0ABW3FHV7_9HYPH
MGETEQTIFTLLTTGLVLFCFGWLFRNMSRLFSADEVQQQDDFSTRMNQMLGVIRPPMAVLFTLGIPAFLYFVVRSGIWF